MHKQSKMAVRQARAAANQTITGRHSSVTVLPPTPVLPRSSKPARRTKARMTAAQRNSLGQRSEWSRSPYFWTDSAWDRTVTR